MYLPLIVFVTTVIVTIVYIEWKYHKVKVQEWEQIGSD